MSSRSLVINAIAFQAAWFSALYGGIYNWLTLTLVPPILAAIWQLILRRNHLIPEIGLFGGIVLIGFCIETAFIASGAIYYIGTPLFGFGPPLWILAMWLAFATLPHGCLDWLRGKWMLQIVLGALTGPLSYLAGGKLGGATLHEPVLQSLAIIGAGWAIALPVIFSLAGRLTGNGNKT